MSWGDCSDPSFSRCIMSSFDMLIYAFDFCLKNFKLLLYKFHCFVIHLKGFQLHFLCMSSILTTSFLAFNFFCHVYIYGYFPVFFQHPLLKKVIFYFWHLKIFFSNFFPEFYQISLNFTFFCICIFLFLILEFRVYFFNVLNWLLKTT